MDRLDALTLRQLQSFVGATGVTSASPDPDEDLDPDGDGAAAVLWPQALILDPNQALTSALISPAQYSSSDVAPRIPLSLSFKAVH